MWADTTLQTPYAQPAPTTAPKSVNGAILIALGIAAGIGVLLVMGILVFFFARSSSTSRAQRELARSVTSPSIEEAVRQPAPSQGSAGTASSGQASLSDVDCRQFAAQFEQAITTSNVNMSVRSIDWEKLTQTVCSGLDIRETEQRQLMNGFRTGGLAQSGLFATISQQVQNGGSFKLLRIRDVGDQKRIMYRLVAPETGVNYWDCIVERGENGKPLIIDMFFISSGEFISTTFRRAVLAGLAQRKKGILSRLTQQETDYLKFLTHVKEMADLLRRNRHQEVLSKYYQLPDSLQKDKMLLLIRVRAALGVSEQEHLKAIEAFRQYHPRDQAVVDVLSIDGFTLRKNYDQALESVDKLDRAVGGDPYLHTMRAGILLFAGRPQEAEEAVQKAIDALPDLLEPYLTKLAIIVRRKDYARALTELKMLDNRFAMQWEDFRTKPEFAEFVRSPQYQQWLAHLQQSGR